MRVVPASTGFGFVIDSTDNYTLCPCGCDEGVFCGMVDGADHVAECRTCGATWDIGTWIEWLLGVLACRYSA